MIFKTALFRAFARPISVFSMFRRQRSNHNTSIIGSFFNWPESPFRWKTLDRQKQFYSYQDAFDIKPHIKQVASTHPRNLEEAPLVINPLKPSKPLTREKLDIDQLVIRVNPIKFPAVYIEPKRNFIPSGRRALARTPPHEKRRQSSPSSDDELDRKSVELRLIEDSLLRRRNEIPRTPILKSSKDFTVFQMFFIYDVGITNFSDPKTAQNGLKTPTIPRKDKDENRKEIAIQTGGIMTVRQKSTLNYIPSGRNQLKRSAHGERLETAKKEQPEEPRKSMEINIEVYHDNDKVSKMNLRGTSQINLRIKPEESSQDLRASQSDLRPSQTDLRRSNQNLRSRLQRTSSRIGLSRKSTAAVLSSAASNSVKRYEDSDSLERIMSTKTLKPIKSTTQGVLMVLVDK